MARKLTLAEEQVDLLRTLLVVQLRLAGVPQKHIAKIAKCGTHFVSDIIKEIPASVVRAQSQEG